MNAEDALQASWAREDRMIAAMEGDKRQSLSLAIEDARRRLWAMDEPDPLMRWLWRLGMIAALVPITLALILLILSAIW